MPEDPRRVAGELQLSGPDRRLRRERRRRRMLRACAGRGRPPRGQAEGLRGLPLAARRARRRPAAARDRARAVPGARLAVHVHSHRARRVGATAGAAARRPAHRAGPLHAGRFGADEGGRAHLRRGRAGERALRARQADRPERQGGVGEQPRLARQAAGSALRSVSFASLEGKTALVTGASRGIGRAVAAELAEAGAAVVLGFHSGGDEAEALAAELGARAVQADVSSPDEARRLVEEAGDVDILVNNAGLTRDGVLARMPDDDWRTVIETNLSSVFYTCRAVCRPMMRKRAGAIVNVSSIVGVHGNWGQTNYGASKAGIIGFTKSLAKELGSRNVRANVVAPGYVTTRLTEALIAGESGAAPITLFDHTDFPVHFACEAKDFEPTEWIDRKQARRMDRFAQFTISAARQAEQDAGLDIAGEPDRVGVSVATGI